MELKYTKKKKEIKIRCASDFAVNFPLRPLIKEEYEEFNFSNFNNHRSFLVYIYSQPRPRLSFLKMLSLKRSGWFESSVSLQLSLLSGLPLPWYLWCFPTSVNGFCNLHLIAICNWMSKEMQDCIGFIFLFSDWSRKIAPPPQPIKCKSAENQWHLSLKRYSAFQPGFVFLIWVSISSLWNFPLSWLTAVIS